jgi:hypothetical protein
LSHHPPRSSRCTGVVVVDARVRVSPGTPGRIRTGRASCRRTHRCSLERPAPRAVLPRPGRPCRSPVATSAWYACGVSEADDGLDPVDGVEAARRMPRRQADPAWPRRVPHPVSQKYRRPRGGPRPRAPRRTSAPPRSLSTGSRRDAAELRPSDSRRRSGGRAED